MMDTNGEMENMVFYSFFRVEGAFNQVFKGFDFHKELVNLKIFDHPWIPNQKCIDHGFIYVEDTTDKTNGILFSKDCIDYIQKRLIDRIQRINIS